jgi:hypothetical protein
MEHVTKEKLQKIKKELSRKPWLSLDIGCPCRYVVLGFYQDLLPSGKYCCPKAAPPPNYTREDARIDGQWLRQFDAQLKTLGLERAEDGFGQLSKLHILEKKRDRTKRDRTKSAATTRSRLGWEPAPKDVATQNLENNLNSFMDE